jgi:hypothetical protein
LSTFSVYINESQALGKPYGLKVRCYWERFGEKLENLGNPLGPHESTIGNMMRTRKEKKNYKILAPLLPEKGKFWTPHGSMLSLSLVTSDFYLYGIKILFWIFHPIHMHIQPTMILNDITLSLLAKMYVVF